MNQVDSKTKRAKLAPRPEPYWSRLVAGGHVGFRRLAEGDGTWIARWRDDEGKQHYRALGHFDDYDEAAKAARAWIKANERGTSPSVTTVQAACKAYVESLKVDQRLATAKDAEGRFKRLVYGKTLGEIELDKLKTTHITRWRGKQIEQGEDDDEEDLRKAKDSANRNLNTLKAALNHAYRSHLVASDSGWKTVTPFSDVARRRKAAYLDLAARQSLLAKCEDDLHAFLKALLLTGARPGEIARLNAADFDRKQKTLTLNGKTGTRTVAVSSDAAKFFAELSREAIGSAPMLRKSDGGRWDKDAWKKPIKIAANAAGLPAEVVAYSLRHTAISEMIMGGMDTYKVAALTGTSVLMIERNYGHLQSERMRAELDRVRML
jgi:integrase